MKKAFRLESLKRRDSLSHSRRKEASQRAFQIFSSLLSVHQKVLSFAPLKAEIDLWSLNSYLLKKSQLLLPRIEEKELQCFEVKNLESDLILSSWNIWEPNPKTCKRVFNWDVVLVPGLAFDFYKNRLGYGKGFYDRLLNTCSEAYSIGVGFKEQYQPNVPTEQHDRPLQEVFLF